MPVLVRLYVTLFLIVIFLTTIGAQDKPSGASNQSAKSTATAEKLRIVGLEKIGELRLEIISADGIRIYDSGLKAGNLLDWDYRTGQREQIPAGTYQCVITSKDLQGNLSSQSGTLTITSDKQIYQGDKTTSEIAAVTLLAHDGENGRVVSSRGGLRFYSGNVFAGREVELMRITEQGYLGIGIQSPQAKLDVNGMIRTHGIVFPDGSIQTSALITRSNPIKTQNVSGDGGTTANIGGSGTTGKLPKWTDGASGTLGDSVITESSGNIGIGISNPNAALDVSGSIKSDKLYVGVVPNAVASTDFRGVIGDIGGGSTEYYFTNIFPSYSPTNNVGGTSNNFFGITLDANIYDTTATGNLSGRHTGGRFRALTRTGTRTVSEVVGGQFNVVHLGNGSSFGNVTNAYAGLFSTSVAGGTIANNYGAFIGNPNGAGSITNNYGLYLEAQNKATNNWAIYAAGGQSYFGGNVGIGILSPTASLQVAGVIHSTTGGIKFPDGTTQTTAGGGTVTGVTASGVLSSSGGITPNITFTGTLPIANGGTGSATQNFVDLTNTQTIGGAKTFSGAVNTNSSFSIGGTSVLSNAGADNLFVGNNAGASNTTGNANTFSGAGAGYANTSGFSNTFSGNTAGANNTTGSFNTFNGSSAGSSNSTGVNNTFSGFGAGGVNSTGHDNTFTGTFVAGANTTGSFNTALGVSADVGDNYTNATAIGAKAAVACSNCLVLGSTGGVNNATATVNVGIGITAPTARLHVVGNAIITGTLTANGNPVISSVTASGVLSSSGGITPNITFTGVLPIANGGTGSATQNFVDLTNTQTIGGNKTFTGAINTTSQFNLNGNRILSNPGNVNLFVGINAGSANTTGNSNTFNGFDAGLNNMTGSQNTFNGAFTGLNNTSGNNNTFNGFNAGAANQTGEYNTALGYGTNFASNNFTNATVIGANAYASCSNCVVLGSISGVNSATASANVGIGTTSPNSAALLDVRGDTWVNGSLFLKQDRANSSSRNWAIMENAAHEGDFQIGFTGTNTGGLPNFFANASDAKLTISNAGNVGIGTNTPTAKLHVVGDIFTTGNYLPSDFRYKQGIQTLGQALNKIQQLRGVSYYWKTGEYPRMGFSNRLQYGFIAQELKEVLPEAVHQSEDGMYSVNYTSVIPVLVEAVKEQQSEIEQKTDENRELKKQVKTLEERLSALEKQMQQLIEAKAKPQQQ